MAKRRLLTQKCSQPKMLQCGARSILVVSLVRALRLSEKKKKRKRTNTKHGKNRWRLLHVGVP